jgi:hypothetical protein
MCDGFFFDVCFGREGLERSSVSVSLSHNHFAQLLNSVQVLVLQVRQASQPYSIMSRGKKKSTKGRKSNSDKVPVTVLTGYLGTSFL